MADQPTAFTRDAARRIADATRQVEATPQHTGQRANPSQPAADQSFWARIGSMSIGTGGYSWHRMIPVGDGRLAFSDQPLYGPDSAFEATAKYNVPVGAVVRLYLNGYDANGQPTYTFSYGPAPEMAYLRPHDHRDNQHGGFAFAVYHPGTALPQQPWAI
jgi:hypothetical protein